MTDTTEATETTELPHIALLRTWQVLLTEGTESPGDPDSAGRILNLLERCPRMDLEDTPVYDQTFEGLLYAALGVVEAECGDPESFKVSSMEEDAEKNRLHYINTYLGWLTLIRFAEAEWSHTQPSAVAAAYAVRDIANLLLGSDGLVAHLDVIGVRITDDEMRTLDETARFDEEAA